MKEDRIERAKDVGIWIRVSTDEQAQGDSPEHHEVRARSYAEAKGWTVRTVYNLAGVSGKTVMGHPECKRMMEDVRLKRITGLIFSALFRLCRNKRELEDFSDFFRENEADMISIQDAIDTTTPMGRMFYTFRAAQGQWEREEIAGRVAVSVPIRAKLGKPLGGQAPFGYRWEGKKLVIDPKDAPVRKLIYEIFAEHKRKRTVARILNERGFRTRDRKNVKGGLFTATTVERLIKDPTAKGEHRSNYTKSLGDKKHWKVKAEHEWVINPVEPIVSTKLWDECNALLEARKTKGERPTKKGKNALQGFVVCHCGEKMRFPYNTPKWVCLKCRNKIPVADLDALFRDEIKNFMVSAEKVASYVATTQNGVAEKKTLLATLKKERERLKIEANECFELYHAGGLTVPQFKERFQPVDARKQQLEREIPRLEGEVSAESAKEVSADYVASEAHSFYDNWPKLPEDRKRQIVEVILKDIVVGKDDVSINLFNLPAFASA